MANTYELIQSTVLGSNQSGIDFSSIPNTYDDLVLYTSIRSTKAVKGTTAFIRFNNDSTSNAYEYKQIYGFSGGTGGYENTGYNALFSQCQGTANTANIYNCGWYYMPQYTGSYYKAVAAECHYPNSTGADWQSDVWSFGWKNTSVISSINLSMDGDQMAAGSVVSLYGIKYTA